MKKQIYCLVFILAAIMLAGCNSSEVEYIPVSLDSDGNGWSFMNSKGEVVLENEFENQPSFVKDGVFTVKEGETYTLYKFDKKKPKAIMEDLVFVGTPQDGILPLCHKDNRIDVVKVSGDIIFTLDIIDGQTVYSCDNTFRNGYLIVTTMNNEGKMSKAAVDAKGRCVIKPHYEYLAVIGEDLFVGKKADDDKAIVFNEKETKISTWKSDMEIDVTTKSDKYIVVRKNDRYSIYNLKGEEIVKCKDKIEKILEVLDDSYIYKGEEDRGVLTFDGEDILRPKFYSISSFDGGYITKRDYNDKIQVWNVKGEEVNIKSEWDDAFQIPNFGIVGIDGNEFSLLDESFEEKNSKNRFYYIGSSSYGYSDIVYSDFFDYNAVTSIVENIMNGELNTNNLMPGNSLSECKVIDNDLINDCGRYSEKVTIDYTKGVRFGISLTPFFDGYVQTPVYSTRQVVRQYGYRRYYDTVREIDHYEKNDSAKISGLVITVRVPSDKREEMMNKLKTIFETKYKDKFNYEYKEYDNVILIKFDKGNVVIHTDTWHCQENQRYEGSSYNPYYYEDAHEELVIEEAPVDEDYWEVVE